MFVKKLAHGVFLTLAMCLPVAASANAEMIAGAKTIELWKEPKDISARNLYYGPGGKAHQPHGNFVFVKEDLDGTNPKFVVRDQDGVKWKVKMGNEARPETVATRIAWAVGYYTNEDYFVPRLLVTGMPAHLHRGQNLVSRDGSVYGVRLKREEVKKAGAWEWRQSPFSGTRELNGLRVVMALMNNWDLKDENNAVYQEGSKSIYAVSDLGASFGSASRTWPKSKSKGDLESYERSKFVDKVSDGEVKFRTPARPSLIYILNPKEYFQRVHMEWIGRGIPREDVRWMGQLLSRLSTAQLRDAFRAGGYSPVEVEGFVAIMEKRIRLLTDL
jgi:hypothetical protein